MDLNGAVVAEAEPLSDANAEDLAARPELHEFVTALEESDATDSPMQKTDEISPSLAAATRTRWIGSSRISVSAEHSESVSRAAAKFAHSSSIERADDSDKDSAELPAMPLIDPTTRNVVLSICLLGTLARVTARRRRRQKAALLAQEFAAH
jgi:hypothetical protein